MPFVLGFEMKRCAEEEQTRWRRILQAVRVEAAGLAPAERAWINAHAAEIACRQEKLDALFEKAGGPAWCRRCEGTCCDRGRHHLTLANLLACLLAEEEMPEPDFARPCPFLGDGGCLLPAGRRPFNCITFLCEEVEEGLSGTERQSFYTLEKELRTLYGRFDRRYAGSSPRGLLIRAERLSGRPFLDVLTADCRLSEDFI